MAQHHYLLSITVRDRSHSDLRVSNPSTRSHDYYVKSNRIEVMAHQPTIALMLCLNDVPSDVSAGAQQERFSWGWEQPVQASPRLTLRLR